MNSGEHIELRLSVERASEHNALTCLDLNITVVCLVGDNWSNIPGLWRKARSVPGPWENRVLHKVLNLDHLCTGSIVMLTPSFSLFG